MRNNKSLVAFLILGIYHNLLLAEGSIGATDDGLSRSLPYESVYPGVAPEEIGQAIRGAMSREIARAVQDGDPDPTGLFRAMLLTEGDGSGESLAQTVVFLARTFGQMAVVKNPIPELQQDFKVKEGDGSPVLFHNVVHDNWSGTLGSSKRIITYYPKTRQGIINIVKRAAKEKARVRASGLKHSWSDLVWGVDQDQDTSGKGRRGNARKGEIDYRIAMVPYELSDSLYLWRADIPSWREAAKELNFIEGPLKTWTDEDGSEHASVRVGPATLSTFLMEWGLENGWSLSSEPNPPIFTLVGVVATNSHGSGVNSKSVADMVMDIEYVDADGNVQYVDDPAELDAVVGSYGLFGIILSMTLKLDRISYTRFQPLTVWQPTEEYLPRNPSNVSTFLQHVFANFDYSTWYVSDPLGYPAGLPTVPRLQQFVWKADPNIREEDATRLFTPFQDLLGNAINTVLMEMNNVLREVMEDTGRAEMYWLHSVFDTQFNLLLAGRGLSQVGKAVNTTTVEANHFLRGTHVAKIWNFEINVPIRDDGRGNPDWTTIQDVFWQSYDIINSYESHGLFPTDVFIEFRLLGGSTRLLSPFYGNKHGTVSINVSRTQVVPQWLWDRLRHEMAAHFQRFDTGPGMNKARHHLAKELPDRVDGQTTTEYLADTFKEQLDLFREKLGSIVKSRGGSVKKTLERFSTRQFDQLLKFK